MEGRVSTEIDRAQQKETELQGLIEGEVTARDNAIIALQSSLDDNVNTLTTSINSETDERVSAINNVNNSLNSAVNTINSSISDENTRAVNAESTLNTAISGEFSRAFDAENALDAAKLDKSVSYYKDNNGYFRVASSAYLMIGDRWRISCNSGDSEQRRLVFEYRTIVGDDNSFVVGVPFIQSQ